MTGLFYLQGSLPISYDIHLGILSVIMIAGGLLGGYAGYLIEKNRFLQSSGDTNNSDGVKKEKVYFLITGVCAALLIPLFLSTISSQLMGDAEKDPLKYFVFGGFCLLVAIFSKQFISSLSDKILKQVKDEVHQQTTAQVNAAFDEKKGFINEQVVKEVNLQTTPLQNRISVNDELTKLESQVKNPNNPRMLTLKDVTDILDHALDTNDPDLPTQVYDRISILCYDLRQYDLLEAILELYKNKIKLSATSLADLAIANMNSYNEKHDQKYRDKSEEYVLESLKAMPDYGVPFAIRLYLLLIDYNIAPKDSPKAKQLAESIKGLVQQVNALSVITLREVFNYIKLNENTGFAKYNNDLKTLFPDEWKILEDSEK
jgi:hypothetical protein